MNQVVTLSSVETKKTGTNKRGPWALRIFETAGGTKFQTFDVSLGESLESHLNLPIEITYEIEDNGDFKNNVIKGWKPSSETAVQATQASEPVQSKQRSKEEVRYTAAVHAAAVILASPNDFQIGELKAVADAINDLIAA